MNDSNRAEWVDNDEGLYNLWRSSRQSKNVFIRGNRVLIDSVIENVSESKKPAHYLAYGQPENRS